MSDSTVLALSGGIMTAVALLIVVLTWLAARGTLPLNPVAGIRVAATMQSPAAWRTGHRAALPATITTAVVELVGVGVVVLTVRPVSASVGAVSVLGLAAVLVIGLVIAGVIASRAVRRMGDPQD